MSLPLFGIWISLVICLAVDEFFCGMLEDIGKQFLSHGCPLVQICSCTFGSGATLHG